MEGVIICSIQCFTVTRVYLPLCIPLCVCLCVFTCFSYILQSQIYQFETVRARPFEDKPRPYYRPQAQSPPPPLVSPPQPAPPQQPQ